MFALLPGMTAEAAGILLPITPPTNDPGCSYQEGSVSARLLDDILLLPPLSQRDGGPFHS